MADNDFRKYSNATAFNIKIWNQFKDNLSGAEGDKKLASSVFGAGTFTDGRIEFILTLSLSVFSASLGLAKCLKNGVAKSIGGGGCLDGLLSARYLLALFMCAACLVSRGSCLGFVVSPFGSVSNNLHLD